MNKHDKRTVSRFQTFRRPPAPWRQKLQEIIFEADTPAGKAFDVALLILILASVAVVLLDSMPAMRQEYGALLTAAEWGFTIIFTVEYVLRLICVGRPLRYAASFYGMVDLLAILPTYLSLLLPSSRYLLVIRALRLLRVFRVLKLASYTGEAQYISRALRASRRKILVFLFTVLTLVLIFGALLYVIEGEENGFTSIPRSIYWAVVTLTTVGYGDIAPKTGLGQTMAALIMILGYGIIAVPTGIVTAEMTRKIPEKPVSTQSCPSCSRDGHDVDALYCKYCGTRL